MVIIRKQNNSKTPSIKPSSYLFSADFIRTLAISGVVFIHTANAVFGRPDFFGGFSWWIAIILNAMSRISIPLFIMLSGYFILHKDEPLLASFKRTTHRIVIPFLFWFLAYTLWNKGNLSLDALNISLIFKLLTVNAFHFYFFIILIGLYIVAPFLRAFIQKTDYTSQKLFTIFALCVGMFISLSEYLYHLCSPANSFTYWLPFTGLFFAGYFLGTYVKYLQKKVVAMTYGVALLCTIGLSYLYYFFHNQGKVFFDSPGCITYYFDAYLSINVIIMSVSAFVLLFHFRFPSIPSFFQKLTFSIARNSLGIFVIHAFFLDFLDAKLHLFDAITPVWFYMIVKWFVIFSLSYLCSAILIHTPVVKRVLGEK